MASQFLRSLSLLRVQAVTPAHRFAPAPPRRWYASVGTRRPRDDKIEFDVVRLVDPETHKPGDPQSLPDLVKLYKAEKKYFVELVALPSETTGGYPLVKLVDKKLNTAREKVAKQKQLISRKQQEQKEIQLTWSVARGDLEHKLRKVRDEIVKGHRVDLAFAPKKKQHPPPIHEQEAMVKESLEVLQDVAKEWSPRRAAKGMLFVYLQHKDRPLPPKSAKVFAGAAAQASEPSNASASSPPSPNSSTSR